MTHTIESPLARRIIAAGHDLHFKMTEGRAQWWVSSGCRVTAAPTLRDLAESLGIQEHDMSDLITTKQAAAMTGYSVSFINTQIGAGAIKGLQRVKTLAGHRNMIPKESVAKWHAERQALGQAPRGSLGPRIKSEHQPPKGTDHIDVHRAARITGYSATAIFKAIRDKELECHRNPSGRGTTVSRAAVVKWAEERRKKGGSHLPRVRRKTDQAVKHTPQTDHSTRLDRYIAGIQGTPMEMTAEEFTRKAVNQALDRLGVK